MPHNQNRKYRFTIYETDDNGNKVVGPDGKQVVKEKGEGTVTVSLPGKNDNDYDGAFSAIEKKLGADFRKMVVKAYWDKALTYRQRLIKPSPTF